MTGVVHGHYENFKKSQERSRRGKLHNESPTCLPYTPAGHGLPGGQAAGRSLRLVLRPPLADLVQDPG